MTANEIKSDEALKEKDEQTLAELNDLNNVPRRFDDDWWKRASENRDEISRLLPTEALPSLLDVIQQRSQREWSSFFTEEAILLTKKLVDTHGITHAQKQNIEGTLNDLIARKSGVKDFEESIKFANDVLLKLKDYKTKADLGLSQSENKEIPVAAEILEPEKSPISERVELTGTEEEGVWERNEGGAWEFLEAEDSPTSAPTPEMPKVEKSQPSPESVPVTKKESLKKPKKENKSTWGKILKFFGFGD